MTCRSKTVKIVAILKKYFFASSPELGTNLFESSWEESGDTDQKQLKSFRSEIQDSCHDGHLENLIFEFSPKPKGQLT